MTFRYENCISYKSKIILENGSNRTIHFLSKYRPNKGESCDLLKCFIVKINEITDLPFLRKDKFVN